MRLTDVVVADDDETRLSAALETIFVPVVHPDLAFVLSTMVGHLFGYEAALAIDATARPLREARGRIEAIVAALMSSLIIRAALAVDFSRDQR